MIILFIVLMGLMFLSLVGNLSGDKKVSSFSFELLKIAVIGLCFYSIIGFINWNEPTAMDVYRGRTTLEITYKDSVAIDSVVVFKDKEEQQ